MTERPAPQPGRLLRLLVQRFHQPGAGLGRRAVLGLDALIDLAPQDAGVRREGEAELDGLPPDLDHRYFDRVVDDDRFANFPRQIEHLEAPLRRAKDRDARWLPPL